MQFIAISDPRREHPTSFIFLSMNKVYVTRRKGEKIWAVGTVMWVRDTLTCTCMSVP